VKDGVLRERGFQAWGRENVLWRFSSGFLATVHQLWQPKICDNFLETDIQ
jgi:hypothetical protein